MKYVRRTNNLTLVDEQKIIQFDILCRHYKIRNKYLTFDDTHSLYILCIFYMIHTLHPYALLTLS